MVTSSVLGGCAVVGGVLDIPPGEGVRFVVEVDGTGVG
jgi:hypothetical protein